MIENFHLCVSSGSVTCPPAATLTSPYPFFPAIRAVLRHVSNQASVTPGLATTVTAFSPEPVLSTPENNVYVSNTDRAQSSLGYNDERVYSGHYAEMTVERDTETAAAVALCNDNQWGEAPLNFAAGEGLVNVMDLLLAQGANVESPARFPLYKGMTPLHTATVFNQSEAIECILKHGADINARWNGLTALMISQDFESSDIAITRLLLEKGIDVDASDFDGNTALMYAARLILPDHFDLIFNHGADLWRINNLGQTVFLVAVRAGNTPLVSFLLARGADILETNNRGWTAMDYAYGATRDVLLMIGRPAATRSLYAVGHTTGAPPKATYRVAEDKTPSARRFHKPMVKLLRQSSGATSGAAGRVNFSGRWITDLYDRTLRLGDDFLKFFGDLIKHY